MMFGQTGRRMVLGAGFLALSACIPDEVPPPAKPAAPAADSAKTDDSAAAIPSNDLLKTVEKMKGQLKSKDRDFNVNAALGNLYYDNGKYIDAIEYYTDAMDQSAALEKRLLAIKDIQAGEVPAACQLDQPEADDLAKGQKQRSFESVVKIAGGLEEKAAAACLRQLLPSIAGVHARRGNSWYLVGNAEKAQVDHAAALALDPNNPEALFFSGAAALETSHGDPAKIAEGKAYWERLLKTSPNHPRAELVRQTMPRIDELFGNHPKGPMAGHPPVGDQGGPVGPGALPAGMAEAASNAQRTPEENARLDKLVTDGEALLKLGKWDEALASFKQVMAGGRPDGRVALGMGIALRELGKPTAERVLMTAASMPGGDPPRAKYELAVFYAKKDPAQAKAIFSELQNDPKVGSDAKAQLAKLQ